MTSRFLAWKTEQMVGPFTETRNSGTGLKPKLCLSLGQGSKGVLHLQFWTC